jgi:hypothetical protein
MSLELVLVFALAAPLSADRLQSALDRKGIPIRFPQSDDLQMHTGFLPLEYEEKKTGFYVTQLTQETFRCARILISGIEIMHIIRNGRLGDIKDSTSSAANQFDSLAF